VELGWTAILLPETAGGLGLGLVDLVVVLEEMGKVPLPGPFLASAGYAARAAVLFGDEALQTALAAGDAVGAVAVEELGVAGDPFASVHTDAARDGDQWRLTGVKPLVVDGHVAEVVVVCANDGDGLAAFVVTEPTATLQPSMDPTRALARLDLDGTPSRRIGQAGDQTALWRRWADDAAVMMCAESVGACDRAFEVAGEYSKNRVQFGKPIGAFQAIKHLEAEMLQDLTLARVGVHYAAWASDVEAPAREAAAAMAKAWTGEAAVRVTSTAIQIHGGVGFTWDALVHLHYKRAKTNDLLLGRQGWQRERVADLLLGPAPARS
jgi:alkylation response protein AidB-like acyl-CoA dehydrogenase